MTANTAQFLTTMIAIVAALVLAWNGTIDFVTQVVVTVAAIVMYAVWGRID